MKKRFILCIILIMSCCMLVGCGKSKPAKETEKLIAAIGEVTLDSEQYIVAAEDYYNILTADQKNEVDSYKVLVDARKQYDELVRQELANIIIGNWEVIALGSGDETIFIDEFEERGYTLEGKMMVTNDGYSYNVGERNESGTWKLHEQDDDMVIFSFSEEENCYAGISVDDPDTLILTFDKKLNIVFIRE